jgi:hypothetical protein
MRTAPDKNARRMMNPPINEIATTGRYDPISRRTVSSHFMEPGLAGLIQVWQPG